QKAGAKVPDVAKGQPVLLRQVVIQPHQPLRSAAGNGRAQLGRCKLHVAAIYAGKRIVAKLYWDRVSRPTQAAQKTQIEIQSRVRGKQRAQSLDRRLRRNDKCNRIGSARVPLKGSEVERLVLAKWPSHGEAIHVFS